MFRRRAESPDIGADWADESTALLAADMSIRELSTASKATAFGPRVLASAYVQYTFDPAPFHRSQTHVLGYAI